MKRAPELDPTRRDPTAEAFLSEWVGAQPTLGLRNMNMESLASTAAAPVFMAERGIDKEYYAWYRDLKSLRSSPAAAPIAAGVGQA
jgi:hypothetical protein